MTQLVEDGDMSTNLVSIHRQLFLQHGFSALQFQPFWFVIFLNLCSYSVKTLMKVYVNEELSFKVLAVLR